MSLLSRATAWIKANLLQPTFFSRQQPIIQEQDNNHRKMARTLAAIQKRMSANDQVHSHITMNMKKELDDKAQGNTPANNPKLH